MLLNSYVAKGGLWGLDTKDSGVFVLTPREKADAGLDVYRGTADAISQNIDFIDTYNPEYLLILSGDHIYKMNYDKMLDFHKAQGAAATIAVMPVSLKEASRFGIMITDENDKIIDFEEKPAHPRSTLASMGIYIFDWKKLREILIKDMADPDSAHDFGKKDVGTIDSLWEANMDLLDENCDLNLDDPTWKIYTEDAVALPAYIGPDASIDRAYITQGTSIDGYIKNSVIFTGATVGKGAKIIDSVLMPNVCVGDGAVVTRALVADDVKISAGAVVGSADSEEITLQASDI